MENIIAQTSPETSFQGIIDLISQKADCPICYENGHILNSLNPCGHQMCNDCFVKMK